jgi:hypothetical protein
MAIRTRILLSLGLLVVGLAVVWTFGIAGAAGPSATRPGASTSATARGPFLLTSLASLGRLTWRCDPARTPGLAPGLPGLALGYRAFRASATQRVSLTAGGRTVLARRVDPGASVRFPYLQRRLQTIVIRQFTGAGRVRATITATFSKRTSGIYCFSYQSPQLDVHMTPRR